MITDLKNPSSYIPLLLSAHDTSLALGEGAQRHCFGLFFLVIAYSSVTLFVRIPHNIGESFDSFQIKFG